MQIIHILADGTKLDSIEGHVVGIENTAVYDALFRGIQNMKERERQKMEEAGIKVV